VTAHRQIEARLAAAGLPGLPRTAWLEIDLDALSANLATLRAVVPAGVRVEPAVKADAYGHGAVPIAVALEAAGADGLCVATFDEAVELRDAGVRLPVLVLFPVPPGWAAEAARRRIALTVGDPSLLERTLAVVREIAARGRPLRPALRLQVEVETGLGRGGLPPAAVAPAAAAIGATRGARLTGIWSHLAAAEDRARSRLQAERFAEVERLLAGDGLSVPPRHLAASGGLLAGSAAPLDAVRPGLALYGIVPEELTLAGAAAATARRLRPLMSLHARPVRVSELPAGSGVSYGPSFVTERRSLIATLPLGYGDGLARPLSNRAEALVRGHRVPLVGTIAMDAVMADVTDVPGPPVTVDDEFVLLGRQGSERIAAVDLARPRTTISWEVVTAMARRLARVYTAGSVPVGLRTLTGWRVSWPISSSGTATSATSRSTRS
jgi:alanine racemase